MYNCYLLNAVDWVGDSEIFWTKPNIVHLLALKHLSFLFELRREYESLYNVKVYNVKHFIFKYIVFDVSMSSSLTYQANFFTNLKNG